MQSNYERIHEIAENYWSKIIQGIFVPNKVESEDLPCTGDVLDAFNELKNQRPDLNLSIPTNENPETLCFANGTSVPLIRAEIKLANSFEARITFDKEMTILFSWRNQFGIRFSEQKFDVHETIKNLENFADHFHDYWDPFEQLLIKSEKKAKLEAMARTSIKAGVKQILAGTRYQWELKERGETFYLNVEMGKNKLVSMSLNSKNFPQRISVLEKTLQRIKKFMDSLPFPVEISMINSP